MLMCDITVFRSTKAPLFFDQIINKSFRGNKSWPQNKKTGSVASHSKTSVCTLVTRWQFKMVQVLNFLFSKSRISNISLYNYISLFKINEPYYTPAGVYIQFNQNGQIAAVFLSTVWPAPVLGSKYCIVLLQRPLSSSLCMWGEGNVTV